MTSPSNPAQIVRTADYEERVYAGVLGKIIGVYLGRPFEGWSNERIERELGEVWYYVHDKLGVPLIVADDDISGTFTFLRALPDHGCSHDLSAEQIGQTWLNYLVEGRTVLWWGGMGMSTEHTAFLRLKAGVPAPRSGSMELNGKVVAEQIGSQIFIDGWAMVCPGDPERAVELARKAASVSHDGEAVYGAQVVAAMEALAFVEPDIPTLIDAAQRFIPRDSVISRLIDDLREWHRQEPRDWRATFRKVEECYGYDTYGGNCHMVPNHAVILLALLYGEDDFQKSLMIANTAGWDTDCNSANVGCLMGIKNGLAGIGAGADFRGPVADRMFLPTADGGRCVSDALSEAYRVVNIGRALYGVPTTAPNGGARFHFSLPGAVQGFVPDETPDSRGACRVENAPSPAGGRGLAIRYAAVAPGRPARAAVATFPAASDLLRPGSYQMLASPSLYPGQTVRARVCADPANARPAEVRLFVGAATGPQGASERLPGPARVLAPGEEALLEWRVPDTDGRPVAEAGFEVRGRSGSGTLHLDSLTWDGAPDVTLGRPATGGDSWRRAWVNAADHFVTTGLWAGNTYKLLQNEGTGCVLQGDHAWSDYTVSAGVYPHLADEIGLMANVRGLRRYLSLVLRPDGVARLLQRHDGGETVLAQAPLPWALDHTFLLSITTRSDGSVSATAHDGHAAVELRGSVGPERAAGAVGLLVRAGHGQFGAVRVRPAAQR